MPCQRRLYRNLGGFPVADFAHQHNVGVLPQDRAQARRKGQPNLIIDLGLADPVDGIFNRVFDGQYVALAVVQLLECCIKRRRFARSRWPRDEDDAVGFPKRCFERGTRSLVHPERVQAGGCIGLVEQAQNHPFPAATGESRHTDIDQPTTERERNPPVLGQSPFRDVEP